MSKRYVFYKTDSGQHLSNKVYYEGTAALCGRRFNPQTATVVHVEDDSPNFGYIIKNSCPACKGVLWVS